MNDMRTILFSLVLFSALLPLKGQQLPLLEDTLFLQLTVREEGGLAIADWHFIQPEAAVNSPITVHELKFSDAALSIRYHLKRPEKDFYYGMALCLKDARGLFHYPETWSVKGDYQRIKRDFEQLELTWANALEEGLDFNRPYLLILTAQLYGDLALLGVSCEKRPAFTYREQFPNYLGLAAGVGLIGIGQAFKSNADEDYQQYLKLWQSGNPRDEARPFLDAARSKDDTYKILTITGIAVLSVDAVGYAFRFFKYKKKVRQYGKYCSEKRTPGSKPLMLQISATPDAGGIRAVIRF